MSPKDASKMLSEAVINHAAGMAACGLDTRTLELSAPTPWSTELALNGKPLYRATLLMTDDTIVLKEEILIHVEPIKGFEMWFPK
jgi:hypothetical protein